MANDDASQWKKRRTERIASIKRLPERSTRTGAPQCTYQRRGGNLVITALTAKMRQYSESHRFDRKAAAAFPTLRLPQVITDKRRQGYGPTGGAAPAAVTTATAAAPRPLPERALPCQRRSDGGAATAAQRRRRSDGGAANKTRE